MSKLNMVFRSLLESLAGPYGHEVSPRGHKTYELTNVHFMLDNPLDRFIMRPTGKLNIAKAIGRTLWELRGADDLESIAYYDDYAQKFANRVTGTIPSAYGKRILSRLHDLGLLFATDESTRRGTILILSDIDDAGTNLEYPCLLAVQVSVRNSKLNMQVIMRSQSFWNVFPYDLFMLTTFQEYLADRLHYEVGSYSHYMLSCHLYEQDREPIGRFLSSTHIDVPEHTKPLFSPQKDTLHMLTVWERELRMCSSIHMLTEFHEALQSMKEGEMKQWIIILYEYTRMKRFSAAGLSMNDWLIEPYSSLVKGNR